MTDVDLALAFGGDAPEIDRSEGDEHRTAIHEAGHAVISRKLGLPAGDAMIIANVEELEAGHAILGQPLDAIALWERQGKFRGEASALSARIVTMMAGAEAEAEILGEAGVGDASDRRDAAFALDDLGMNDEEHERRFRPQCRTLVRRHRSTIERIAAALILFRVVPGHRLDEKVPTYVPARELPFWAANEAA